LTQALNHFDDHIFIHINKKSPIQVFSEVVQQPHVSIIPNRITVHWGGFSMVHAALNLLSAARQYVSPFQYYCFISGSSYPLRSNQDIHAYFERHSGCEFIDIMDAHQKESIHSLSRLEYFVFELGLTRKTPIGTCIFQLNEKLLKAKLLTRNYQKCLGNSKPYIGGAWWVLSDRAISYIFHFIEHHPRIVDFYRHTAHPLEMFFHTIIGNSPFSADVSDNVTYEDWSSQIVSPSFLTDDHIDYLERLIYQTEPIPGQKTFLFARKFSEDHPGLTERIDQNLRDIKRGNTVPSHGNVRTFGTD
jgi:hypothetical protein